MICLLQGEISIESVNKLVQAYNEAEKLNADVNIYLNTEGGDVGCMECIIDLIDQNKERTTLTGFECLYSAGFFIFFRATCKKTLLLGTLGMFHYIRTPIEIDEKSKAYYSKDKALQAWSKEQNVWTIDLCKKLGFTELEMSKVKKKEEVYFQYSRMKQFLEAI